MERGRSLHSIGAVLTAAVLWAVPALLPGATLQRLSLDELARSSQLIARATSVSAESRVERGGVYTYVRLRVGEAVKGSPGAEILVRVPGGEMPVPGRSDGLVMKVHVPGAPSFSPGVESLLFLTRASHDAYAVTGLSQGKLDLDAAGSVRSIDPARVRPAARARSGDGDRVPVRIMLETIRTITEGGN